MVLKPSALSTSPLTSPYPATHASELDAPARAGGGSLTTRESGQTAFVQIPAVVLVIVAGLAKTQNQPGQARQTQEEQLFRTLRGLRFNGVLSPQLYDQILSEFNKARKSGTVGFAKFQHWLQHSLAQISSGSDHAQQTSLKDIHATLKQARNANAALVRGMQMFSSRSDKTAASLRALQRQAQADLKALQTARDRLQTLLARPEAASFPQEIHTSLKQINGWITTAQSFCRRLEKEIARLPALGRTKKQTAPPTVSGGSSGAQVTHTDGKRGGALSGVPAQKLEETARKKYAQTLDQAAAWVYEQRRKGSSLSDAELCKQAAKNFFGAETHARAIAKAVAGGGGGVQGNKGGGVRASMAATTAGATAANNPPQTWPEAEVRRMESRYQLPHWVVVRIHHNGAKIRIDPDEMNSFSKQRWGELVQEVGGEPAALKLLNALIMGHGEEVGLMALCQKWRELYPSRPLTLENVFRLATSVFGFSSESLHDLDHLGGFLADRYGDRGLVATTSWGELIGIIMRGDPVLVSQNYRLELAASDAYHQHRQNNPEASESLKRDVLTRIQALLTKTFHYGIFTEDENASTVFPDANSMLDALARMTAAGAIVAREIGADDREVNPNLRSESPRTYQTDHPAALNIDVAERYPPLYRWLRGQLIEIYNKHYPDTKKPWK
jgi:hypothetical protein